MFDHTKPVCTDSTYIVRKTKVLSKIDENGYEQRELVTEDVNLITGEVKVIETKHYDWEKTHEH